MPIGLCNHAMVKINATTSFLVGGWDGFDYIKKSWFYDGKWIDGPDLETGRYLHSVGILRDTATLRVYLVVVGGGYGYTYDAYHLNDVEILDVKQNKWWEIGKLL